MNSDNCYIDEKEYLMTDDYIREKERYVFKNMLLAINWYNKQNYITHLETENAKLHEPMQDM